MAKKLSTSKKIRRMLDKGYTAKEIAAKLNCNVQLVYNVKWYDNKRKGIGSLPEAEKVIEVKRPRGRPRKNDTVATPPAPRLAASTIDTSDQEKSAAQMQTVGWGKPIYAPAKPIPTHRSMWQRVKERFASVWR